MKIVIVGAGFTGLQLARLLIREDNDVTLIDNNDDATINVSNSLDCELLIADGNNLETLEKVGIAKADALICVTQSDEINMITCSLVDAVYPSVLKIARVRNYAYYINSANATQNHATTFSGNHRPLYGIDFMIHPDVEAADAIVKAVENGAIGNVVSFDNSNMQIIQVQIAADSVFAGRKLMDVRTLTSTPFLITYVEKDGNTSLADGNTILESGCTVGILLNKENYKEILSLCGSKKKDFKKIVIVGAGRIGSLIAEKIIEPKKKNHLNFFGNKNLPHSQDIVIIDSNEQLAQAAHAKFPSARVFTADATDETFLTDEGLTKFDLAICATHNHELNMVMAAYLESMGVAASISLVSTSTLVPIAIKLGVDVAVPLKDVIVDSIMSHLRGNAVKEVHTISNSELEIIECVIPKDSKIIGKTVKDIADSSKFLVLLVKRSETDEYEIAGGNTSFHENDQLVLTSYSDFSKGVLEFFGN